MTEVEPGTKRTRTRGSAVPTFLKWAGGKGQLLPELLARLPETFGRYHEPFVGSGALYFALRQADRLPKGAALSDANPHLVQVYVALRDEPEAVIDALKQHPYDKDHYYAVRALVPEEMPLAERAARFLYLNRAGFNGLYRENSKGRFNVPFGRYTNPTICPEERLRAASAALQGTEIRCEDFQQGAARAKRGDLVYFDPPYVPLSVTSHFTAYSKGGFDIEAQRRLARVFRTLADNGVHVLLSNSDAPVVHDLYGDETIDRVLARRSINSKSDRRGAIHEVIVTPGDRSDDTRGQQQPRLL